MVSFFCVIARSESAVKNLYILKLSHSQTLKLSDLNKELFPAVHYIFFVFPEPDFLHQKKQKRMPFPSGLRKRFSVSNKVVASFFSYSEPSRQKFFRIFATPPKEGNSIPPTSSFLHPTSKTLFVK